MNMTLDQVSFLVLMDELEVSKLLTPFSLLKTWCFCKSIDGLLDMPDSVELHNVHSNSCWCFPIDD